MYVEHNDAKHELLNMWDCCANFIYKVLAPVF